jgi:deoxyribose-phosphate aldolase
MNIASLIDHSLLSPAVTIADIKNLCHEATVYGFRAICVPPLYVKKAKEELKDSAVKLATVTGFPFGYSAIEAKLAEAVLAIVDGADEIEMVITIAALKNADWQYLAREINTIMPVVKSKGRIMKLILETGLLNDREIITCCDIYGAAGVDILKTSTGFADKGVTVETVKILRKHLADAVKINAGGSNLTYGSVKQLLDAGADYISPGNSIQIVKEAAILN